jgi:hypothetical protein
MTSLVVKKERQEEPINAIHWKESVTEFDSAKLVVMDRTLVFLKLIVHVFVRILEMIVMDTLTNAYQLEENVRKTVLVHVLLIKICSVAKKERIVTNATATLLLVSKEPISVFQWGLREIVTLSNLMNVFVREMKTMTATVI